MPENCKVKQKINTVRHKGKYQVRNSRNGYLYVSIDGFTYKLENPFDFVPDYVDVIKKNKTYKIKKWGWGVCDLWSGICGCEKRRRRT